MGKSFREHQSAALKKFTRGKGRAAKLRRQIMKEVRKVKQVKRVDPPKQRNVGKQR
jgi:hypothetical protein